MKRFLAAALVMALLGCSSSPPYKRSYWERDMESANRMVRNGDVREAAEEYRRVAKTSKEALTTNRAYLRQGYASILTGDYAFINRNLSELPVVYQRTLRDLMAKPLPEAQDEAEEKLLASIEDGEKMDKREAYLARQSNSSPLLSSFATAAGAATRAKINKDMNSADPQKVARARQTNENLTASIASAQERSVSDRAREENNANLCLQTKESASGSKNSLIYINACDVPIVLSVVHHYKGKSPPTTLYFQRVGSKGQHIVIDGKADFADVTGCFGTPTRKFNSETNEYYGSCPERKN